VLGDYRKYVDPAWAGEFGKIKSINVNVGPLPQLCNLPPEEMAEKIDWDLWLGPAPWGPYNSKRCSGSFSINGASWRSFSDYSGGGMRLGRHHFGGRNLIHVRELQPEEVTYSEGKDENGNGNGRYRLSLSQRLIIYHNCPKRKICTSRDRLSQERLPVPMYRQRDIYGDFIECVKTAKGRSAISNWLSTRPC
jgi:hypothetical protein